MRRDRITGRVVVLGTVCRVCLDPLQGEGDPDWTRVCIWCCGWVQMHPKEKIGLPLPQRSVGPAQQPRVLRAIEAKVGPADAQPGQREGTRLGADCTAPADPDLPEKEVQRRISRRLGQLGCSVYWLSQARKTGQTRGLPDLLVFDPVRGQFWVEVKARRGRQREAQEVFQRRCEQAGVPYVIGGLEAIEAFLRADAASPTTGEHDG